MIPIYLIGRKSSFQTPIPNHSTLIETDSITWSDHILAFKLLVESTNNYGLILTEDYAGLLNSVVELKLSSQLDFLQFAHASTTRFLEMFGDERLFNLKYILRIRIIRFLSKLLTSIPIRGLRNFGFSKKILRANTRLDYIYLVSQECSLNQLVIPNLIKPSADGYIISKDFAKKLITFNAENLISPARVIFSVNRAANFSAARTLISLEKFGSHSYEN